MSTVKPVGMSFTVSSAALRASLVKIVVPISLLVLAPGGLAVSARSVALLLALLLLLLLLLLPPHALG